MSRRDVLRRSQVLLAGRGIGGDDGADQFDACPLRAVARGLDQPDRAPHPSTGDGPVAVDHAVEIADHSRARRGTGVAACRPVRGEGLLTSCDGARVVPQREQRLGEPVEGLTDLLPAQRFLEPLAGRDPVAVGE